MDGKEKEYIDDDLPATEPDEGVEEEVDLPEDEIDDEPGGGEVPLAAQQDGPKPAADPKSRRFQEAVNTAREAKQAAEVARRDAEEARREIARLTSAPRMPDPEEERRRLDMMSESEKFEYLLNKQSVQFQSQLQRLSLQVETQTDQAQFQSRVAADPDLKKYAPEVERRFGELMTAGKPQTRESILKYVLGEALLNKRGSVLPKARAAGAENIRRAQTRPSSPRSNVSDGGRLDDADAAYQRLVRHAERGGTL